MANFIELIEQMNWLSPIVVVPKKNNKLHICIDFQKLNTATKDPHPLSFTNEVLDKVAGHEVYSFFNNFSRYHQIQIAPERPLQDGIYYGLGSVHVGGNAIWIQKCTTHLPKNGE